VAPVNFCPRCGTDQRVPTHRATAVVATTAASTAHRADTLVYLILGWVFAALALVSSPMVFGSAALVMGALAWSHGSRQGMAIVFAAVAATILGLLVTFALDSLSVEEVLTATERQIALLK
jgi:hypothetical protein